LPQLGTPIRPHLILYYVEERHIKRTWKSERPKWKAGIASEAFSRGHSHDHLESAREGGNRPKYPRFRIRHENQALHLALASACTSDERSGTWSSLKGRWCLHVSLTLNIYLLVVRLSHSLCKSRPLSVTMKFSLTLAAALLFPVLVNAQNGNSSVNVSGVFSTYSYLLFN